MPTFALFAAFLVVLVFALRRRSRSIVSLLPLANASDSLFLWGHEWNVFRGEVGIPYLKWALEASSVYRIKAALFRPDIVIVTDNLAVQHIFHNSYEYVKPAAFMPLIVKTVGRGLIWAEGDEHRYLRKLLSRAFTPSAVDAMTDDVFLCAQNCVQRLLADVTSTSSKNPINLGLYISPCTLETIVRVGFGQTFPFDSPESIAINEAWRADVKMLSTFTGFLAPILIHLFPWMTKLPVAALQDESVMKKVMLQIGRRMLAQDNSGARGKDIFSLMVRDGTLTEDQLLENIVTLLFAGHETVSGVVIFTIHDLAENPHFQRRLRKELVNVDPSDYVTLKNLPYLDAVVREGLRLHPPPGDTERVSTRDDSIPLQNPITLTDGQVIASLNVKPGERFIIPWTVLNINPTVWGGDAAQFKPERWLTPDGVPSSGLPRGPFSNISSFSDGPRVCIGWRLAIIELKIILAVLIKSFEFKSVGIRIEKRLSPTLQPFANGEPGQMPLFISPVHADS